MTFYSYPAGWAPLLLVSAGSGLTVFMTSAYQLILLWGVLIGVGPGSMSMNAHVGRCTSATCDVHGCNSRAP